VSAITFSNTYTPEPTKVTINGMKTLTGKTLAGDDFSFTLTGDGGVNDSAKNDAEGKFTFKDIKYTSEGKFEYTVKEVKGSDSTITYDESEYKITVVITDVDGVLTPEMKIEKNADAAEVISFNNKYTPPYIPPVHDDDPTVITIKVRKTWDDSDNTYGLRPDTITVRLFADGVEKAHKTMTKDDGWKEISFTVAYKSGTKYEVKEDAVPGYLTTITGSEKTGGFDIVNKYDGGMGGTGGPGEDPEIPSEEEPGRGGTDEKTEISVTKVWSDNNDRLRKRPTSVTVKLYANGKDSGKELSLTSAAGWKGSFTELPVYDEDDALIVYTVKEVAVSGYTSKVTGDPENGFTITNTIKNTNVPKTGDNSRPALWTGLLLASALGFAAAAFGGKKTGRKKSR
ncbi:MAG: Cna B-type domain-containing protein, partial [Oscillospiraceae bacterium]|nr:Cna B-type domain-containing protein [Oscillospiraceae bacterium]